MSLYEQGKFTGGTKQGLYSGGKLNTPKQNSSLGQQALNVASGVNRAVNEAGMGALKGLGSTAFGIGKLAQTAYNKLPTKDITLLGEKPKALVPEGTAQKVGFGIEQIAEFLIPVGGGAKGVSLIGKIAPKVLAKAKSGEFIARMGVATAKTAGVGAEFGAKTAAQTGSFKQGTKGAAFGVATVPVGAVAGKVLNYATKYLPEKLYSQIFRSTKDDLYAYFKTSALDKKINPTLARELIDRGVFGSSKNMAIYSFRKLDSLEKQIQDLIINNPKTVLIPNTKAYSNLFKMVSDFFGKGFSLEKKTEADYFIKLLSNNANKNFGLKDVLGMRRFLDRMRNTSSFHAEAKLSPRQEEFKTAAGILRNKLAQNPQLKDLLGEERIFIQAVDAIVSDAVKRNNRNVLNLTDAIIGGGGLAIGGLPTCIGAESVIRAFQNPGLLTGASQGLTKLGQGIEKAQPLIRQIPKVVAPTLLNQR